MEFKFITNLYLGDNVKNVNNTKITKILVCHLLISETYFLILFLLTFIKGAVVHWSIREKTVIETPLRINKGD